ncbi:MAG TPA: TetR/AcrR family transcriptional regulator C-terminal domain-containing protein [Steroidobacteraceae bacterium]|nr:TetR/AcrR family transcriptional regulator C-terminal domain-containing protein [Steroidobacteraceae bacterium]
MISPRLSSENIVAIAIEIADEEGLAAVTLRGIAARLAVHVTSLYNHVATKEAVLDGMVNVLLAEARLPTGRIGWEDWVREFAARMRALGRKHPGAFEAFHHGPATGERAAEPFESAFAAFRSAGFDAASTYNAVKATVVAILGYMLEDTLPARRKGAVRTDIRDLPVERFPQVHAMNRVAGKTDPFAYLVEVLITGLAASKKSKPRRKQLSD